MRRDSVTESVLTSENPVTGPGVTDPCHEPQWRWRPWAIAGTPIDQPYPCRCGTWCGNHCPCRGRLDTGHLPATCCAVVALTPTSYTY